MMPRIIVPLLVLMALAAEDTPPTPQTPETAQTPQTNDGPSPAPSPVASTVQPRATGGIARAPSQPSAFKATAIVEGSYDSNVLLLPASAVNDGTVSNQDATGLGTEARLDWRPWQAASGFVKVGAVGRQDLYHNGPMVRSQRYGANSLLVLTPGAKTVIPAFSVNGDRFRIDGSTVAEDLMGRGSVALRKTWHLDILALDVQRIRYRADGLEGRTGNQGAMSWQHWFLFAADDPGRRAEVGVRMARYRATDLDQSYASIRPGIGTEWRLLGDAADSSGRTLRVNADTGFEFRRFQETSPVYGIVERQRVVDANAALTYGLNAHLSSGPFVSWTHRLDTLDDHDYVRWSAGLRLTAAFP